MQARVALLKNVRFRGNVHWAISKCINHLALPAGQKILGLEPEETDRFLLGVAHPRFGDGTSRRKAVWLVTCWGDSARAPRAGARPPRTPSARSPRSPRPRRPRSPPRT